MRDLADVLLEALDWYASALKVEHGEHGRDCWICNAAHQELDHVDEAMAAAVDEALAPDGDEPLEAAA